MWTIGSLFLWAAVFLTRQGVGTPEAPCFVIAASFAWSANVIKGSMAPRAQGTLLRTPPRHERVSPLGVVAPPPIHIETTAFSGSLGMLFQFVHEHKIDLMQVPLFPICRAYFEYLMTVERGNLDEAAAAMMALAYLLERKAWGLLPTPEPEPTAEDDFPVALPTAHEYGLVIETLQAWKEERERFFFRPVDSAPDPYEVPVEMGDVTPNDLARALERLLRRAAPEAPKSLSRPRRSLGDQMAIVLSALSKEWHTLENLLSEPFTREDAVYWFLALLELIRLGQATVRLSGEDVEFARPSSPR